MKVLIAEGDFESRKELNRMLSKFGECDIAIDGREAITAFNRSLNSDEPYDLVCLDISIPELDGYEVLKTIRAMENERHISNQDYVKVIMTSTYNEQTDTERAIKLGCQIYEQKPIIEKEFEDELKTLQIV